jgi:charged multivesicular body protein 1
MDKFEQQFESLDVQTNVMGDAMQSTTTMTTPQNQVDQLMQEVADEAGIELNMNLPQAQGGTVGVATASHEQVKKILNHFDLGKFNTKSLLSKDELSQRLAKLRQE